MIRNWKPDKLKAVVKARLMSNSDQVGKFMEGEARRRLDSIGSPDTKRDKNYRAYLSRSLLGYMKENGANFVQVSVGMGIGNRGTGVYYHGFFIETGSSTAPAHPFLRPAVFSNANTIIQLFVGGE
jgi:hypothetical protein